MLAAEEPKHKHEPTRAVPPTHERRTPLRSTTTSFAAASACAMPRPRTPLVASTADLAACAQDQRADMLNEGAVRACALPRAVADSCLPYLASSSSSPVVALVPIRPGRAHPPTPPRPGGYISPNPVTYAGGSRHVRRAVFNMPKTESLPSLTGVKAGASDEAVRAARDRAAVQRGMVLDDSLPLLPLYTAVGAKEQPFPSPQRTRRKKPRTGSMLVDVEPPLSLQAPSLSLHAGSWQPSAACVQPSPYAPSVRQLVAARGRVGSDLSFDLWQASPMASWARSLEASVEEGMMKKGGMPAHAAGHARPLRALPKVQHGLTDPW